MTDFVTSWEKASDYLYVHTSGARIERRGWPVRAGWYLVGIDGEPERCFEPTPAGCDEAFVSFSGRQAAAQVLTRLIS